MMAMLRIAGFKSVSRERVSFYCNRRNPKPLPQRAGPQPNTYHRDTEARRNKKSDANDANRTNLRESEDRVERRKTPQISSRLGTNLIVSNTEGAKDAEEDAE